MYTKSKAIVLNSIRYQEKSLIVKCFTENDGLITFFVKNAFSKTKTQNISYFQPLTILDIQYKEKRTSSLNYFSNVQLEHPYISIATDYDKSIVIMFLSELISQIIKDEQPNQNLFWFIENSLVWYDTSEFNSDFHLYFLYQLTKYLGFFPDDSYANELYFNTIEGHFTNQYTNECFNEEQSLSFKKGLHLKLGKKSNLNGDERKKILHLLVEYYQQHIIQFKTPLSLQVVSELY